MKPKKYLLIVFSLILLIGCSSQSTEREAELKADVKKQVQIAQELKGSLQIKDEDILDIEAVIQFVNDTDMNQMIDQQGEKLKVFKNYEAHYFDFTGEGNKDVAIVTWDEDNTYMPVIFVTTDIWEDEYYLINSDFRGNEGDEFFSEGSFIIKDDKKNKFYDIAYNNGNEFIQMATRYVSYGYTEQTIQPEISICYTVDNNFEKIDSFYDFAVRSIFTYCDEDGNNHQYDDITHTFTFNEQDCEYNVVETYNMESISLEKLVGENFIVGKDDSLKTFENMYYGNDLETAINYYYNNRRDFSKEARIQYLEDFEEFTNGITNESNYEIFNKDEIIQDGVISSVSISVEPLPEKVSSVFSVVKQYFVPDESLHTQYILKDGFYTITCINSEMTKKIELMKYDREVLVTGKHAYWTGTVGYVDSDFINHEQVVSEIKNMTYPTVLIENLSQIDEVRFQDIWKTNIVIVPEKITYY